MELLFEVEGCLKRRIRITKNHWKLIAERKHPEVADLLPIVQFTIIDADSVRVSQESSDVFLYYKRYRKYFLCVVCKHLNGEGFIITCYLTNKIKEGAEIWRK